MDFHQLLARQHPILLDGALGTMLQAKGIGVGACSESAVIEHPDWLVDIHRSYVEAGSDIIYSATFGASESKLAYFGLTPEEVVPAAVKLARKATEGTDALVALDLGPTGQMLQPTGPLSFEEAYAMYARQVELGWHAGADLVVVETMSDLLEMKAAILAVRENCPLPLMCTMSFEKGGRTFVGCDASSVALTLEALHVDALGINCSLGPREMAPVVSELLRWTTLPVVVKPNAGIPDASGHYSIGPDEFAGLIASFIDAGAAIVGGCCGTDPTYIAAIHKAVAGKTVCTDKPTIPAAVCSASRTIVLDRPRIIGERINPTGKKRFQAALKSHDMSYILGQGLEQIEAGAELLDVNVGLPEIDEPAMLRETVQSLQGIGDAPLQLDSSDPKALEGALRIYAGKPIVNSVNGKPEVLEAVLPLVYHYGAAVVGLTLDEEGIPQSADERVAIARRILDAALAAGIRRQDIYIDCLTMTVSAEGDAPRQTLEALHRVKTELGLKTVLGVSNVSFGLPVRPVVNQAFLTMALEEGLDLAIINPNIPEMTAAVRAFRLLSGYDEGAREFIDAYADGLPEKKPATISAGIAQAPTVPSSASSSSGASTHRGALPDTAEAELYHAVVSGLADDARRSCAELAGNGMDAMALIDGTLIPALDEVGAKYETGIIFLPQLIQSASAAQAAFEVIRTHLPSSQESMSKGTIVLCTVQGDVHDIGKNIVRVLLENYGYTVVDLGKDVSPQAVVDAAQRYHAGLVGLSALMTTTLPNMEKTIQLLHQTDTRIPVVVGGAVLSPETAQRIGADFYAKDAKEGIDVAQKVFTEIQ